MKKFFSIALSTVLAITALNISLSPKAENVDNTANKGVELIQGVDVSENGLNLSKNISFNETTGEYKLRLEAYADGDVTVIPIEKAIPTDIVLVLDQSGSMDGAFTSSTTSEYIKYNPISNSEAFSNRDNLYVKVDDSYYEVTINRSRRDEEGNRTYTYGYTIAGEDEIASSYRGSGKPPSWDFYHYRTSTTSTSKLQALKAAVNNFAASVASKAEEGNVNHRVAVVGFASGDVWNYQHYDYNNTELFVGESQYGYGSAAAGRYNIAFQDMSTTVGVENVSKSINLLDSDGGTLIHLGLNMANGIFNANPIPKGEERNRIVIVFTDGEPGWNGFSTTYANAAISEANDSKNDYGASVYTVGIFSGANPSTLIGSASNPNKFMHYTSSNYPNAISMSNTGAGSNQGYYLAASDAESLKNVFQKISEQIEEGGTQVQLNEEAVVKDVVSDYFNLPANASTESIRAYSLNYTGSNSWSNTPDSNPYSISISQDRRIVSVTGFDFKGNYVWDSEEASKPYGGKKLVIEIPIEFDKTSFGGNGIPSNSQGAAIYSNGEAVISVLDFNPPAINHPINYQIASKDKVVYISDSVNLEDMLAYADFSDGGISYIPNGVNNAFVDITYTLKDGATIIGTYTIPAGKAHNDTSLSWQWMEGYADGTVTPEYDKQYILSCIVSPSTEPVEGTRGASAWNSEADGGSKAPNIYVLKPTITFSDTEIYLGENTDLNNRVEIVTWTTPSGQSPSGEAPQLSYSYEAAAGGEIVVDSSMYEPSDKSKINVQVKVGARDITNHVTFIREACPVPGCDHSTSTTHMGSADEIEFVVHVKSLDLTITKTGSQAIDQNQSFIFNIEGPKGRYQVAVQGNGSRTITGLPIGDYTVTEDASWSWRYSPSGERKTVTLSRKSGNLNVSFVNNREKDRWLDGDSYFKNIFTPLEQNINSHSLISKVISLLKNI